jgi:hypothetical protein
MSESNQVIPPIYIDQGDLDQFLINGTVVKVMKQVDDLSAFQDAAAHDILKDLGPMSKKEADYYNNLRNFKK